MQNSFFASPITVLIVAALCLCIAAIAFVGALYSERDGNNYDTIGFTMLTVLFSILSAVLVIFNPHSIV